LTAAGLGGFLQGASNLSDVASPGTARTHLGLGSAATQDTTAFDAAGAAAAAQAAAEAASVPASAVGAASGVASLDSGSHVPAAQLPAATSGAQGAVELTGDLGGTATSPQVTGTHLASPLPTTQGGTGQNAASVAALLVALGVAALAGAAFSGEVTVPSPVNPSDAATKAYVDSVAAGLDAKPSAKVVATSDLTLSGTQTIDGVACSAGDRVLATGQGTASQNGLWAVAPGAWTRPSDFATGSSQLGAFVFIEGGTAGASSGWVLVGTAAVVVDSGAQTWTQFSGAGEITAGTGLTKTGNTIGLSSPVSAANGGTGQASLQAALNALAGAVTSGQVLRGNGTNVVLAALQAGDIPALAESQITNLVSDLAAKAALAGAVFTGYVAPAVFPLTDAATILVDASLGNVATVTLGGNRTMANPANATRDGQILRFRIKQDATGGRTLTWSSAYDFGSGSAPGLTATAGKKDFFAFEWDADLSKWCYLGAAIPQGF
jgi:hypothetical protein